MSGCGNKFGIGGELKPVWIVRYDERAISSQFNCTFSSVEYRQALLVDCLLKQTIAARYSVKLWLTSNEILWTRYMGPVREVASP